VSRPRAAGFTLLEVLVALAILGLAVVSVIQGFSQGLRLLKLAGDHQKAVLLADEKVREVVAFEAGRTEGTDGAFTWQRATRELPAPELTPVGSMPAWRVYEITVQVRWGERRQVELSTLRTVAVSRGPSTP
jgi:general secretion pathway protein I